MSECCEWQEQNKYATKEKRRLNNMKITKKHLQALSEVIEYYEDSYGHLRGNDEEMDKTTDKTIKLCEEMEDYLEEIK